MPLPALAIPMALQAGMGAAQMIGGLAGAGNRRRMREQALATQEEQMGLLDENFKSATQRAQRAQDAAAFGFQPEQMAQLQRETDSAIAGQAANIRNMGGSRGQMMANLANTGMKAADAQLNISAQDAAMQQQNQQYADQMGAQADMQRKVIADAKAQEAAGQMAEYQQAQQGAASMVGAGTQNLLGAAGMGFQSKMQADALAGKQAQAATYQPGYGMDNTVGNAAVKPNMGLDINIPSNPVFGTGDIPEIGFRFKEGGKVPDQEKSSISMNTTIESLNKIAADARRMREMASQPKQSLQEGGQVLPPEGQPDPADPPVGKKPPGQPVQLVPVDQGGIVPQGLAGINLPEGMGFPVMEGSGLPRYVQYGNTLMDRAGFDEGVELFAPNDISNPYVFERVTGETIGNYLKRNPNPDGMQRFGDAAIMFKGKQPYRLHGAADGGDAYYYRDPASETVVKELTGLPTTMQVWDPVNQRVVESDTSRTQGYPATDVIPVGGQFGVVAYPPYEPAIQGGAQLMPNTDSRKKGGKINAFKNGGRIPRFKKGGQVEKPEMKDREGIALMIGVGAPSKKEGYEGGKTEGGVDDPIPAEVKDKKTGEVSEKVELHGEELVFDAGTTEKMEKLKTSESYEELGRLVAQTMDEYYERDGLEKEEEEDDIEEVGMA